MPWIEKDKRNPLHDGEYRVKVQMSDWPDVVEEQVDDFRNGRWQGFAQFVNEWWEDENAMLKEINIQEMYPDESEQYDMIVHMEIWHFYNSEPKPGDFIKYGVFTGGRMIKEVLNDGVAYFINFVEEPDLSK